VLEHGQRNAVDLKTGERSLANFETYQVLAGEKLVQSAQSVPPKSMRTVDLVRQPDPRRQGELAWRFGLLLGACNLLLLAIGLAATNPRRASNWNLLFALLAFVVYYNLINLSQAWVGGGRVAMGTMLLGLHGAAFALALGLIWWRDNAAVVRWLPNRRPAPAAGVK
jgi:lipopolysaccharide export system permease protein